MSHIHKTKFGCFSTIHFDIAQTRANFACYMNMMIATEATGGSGLIIMAGMACLAAMAIAAVAAPQPGDKAPLVEGINQDGKPWKLADYIGKKAVILYFYPKDNTPGCTKQACGLRDSMGELKQAGVEVVGVSFDSVESHRKFIQDHQLNFTLLADTDGKIADAFGARSEGRKSARRVSFLIDRQGRIQHVTDSPDAKVHLSQMKEAVAKLKQ